MNQRLVTLATFMDPPMAYLAKSRLEYEGIPSWIADDYHINLQWTISLALGGVKIRILESDYEDAQKVLNTDCSEALEQISFPEISDSERCSKCGSTNLVSYNWTRKAAALTLLTGLPIFYFRRRHKCGKCGHTMKISEVK
jgi:ribosomal protein S27AE